MAFDLSNMQWPGDRHRITIVGKTGSGKTQGAAWLLAHRSYDKMPWIVLNWKRDELLDAIPGTKKLAVTAKAPEKPGVYMVHPSPADAEEVDALLWRIWERENTGIFIDEGYMVSPRSAPLIALLTQGRSKRTPVIFLSQRPAWCTRFAFSEADFVQLYKLTDTRDAKTIQQFMPLPIEKPLPAYHSYWWDNGANFKAVLKPVPDRETILDVFHQRLHLRKRVL